MDISYRQIYAMKKEEARKQIVDGLLLLESLSQITRPWHITRNVVHKKEMITLLSVDLL